MANEADNPPQTFVAPDIAERFVMFARNGRWGTCVDCPHDVNGRYYPEFCVHTDRYDHKIGIDQLVVDHKNYVDRVKRGEIQHRR